jgi:NAD(P)H-dependent flavin oxidoreductase YrpB (nitropropane dioxygenase family)
MKTRITELLSIRHPIMQGGVKVVGGTLSAQL